MDVHLTVIDELDEGVQVGEGDVLQHDNRMLAGCALPKTKWGENMFFFYNVILNILRIC